MEKIHKHLLVTARVDSPTEDTNVIRKWLKDLVDIAGMKILIEPVAKYCDDIGNEGVTGAVVITTSHASIHIWKDYIQMDLYSCKDFRPGDILEHIYRQFNVINWKWQIIDRSPDSLFDYQAEQPPLQVA